MAKKQKSKLQPFLKFLDKSVIKKLGSPLKTVDDFLKLPAMAFNFLKEVDVKLIYEMFNVSQIYEFQILDQESPFEVLYKSDPKQKAKIEEILSIDTEIEEKIKKATIISIIAERIRKDEVIIEKKEQKVIVVGLANAGKTTILTKFGGQFGMKDLTRLKPTKGVERREVKTKNLNLNVWDFGGQQEYRKRYLQEPEKYFFRVDLVIYVIDVQDSESYDESLEYFKNILEYLLRIEEYPYVLIFIHKFDPDLKEENEILLNIEHLKDEIKKIFKDKKKLDYDIYLSSIFSIIAREPKFAQYLKNTMEQTATLEDTSITKIEGIASILENTMNGLIRLSETVMEKFDEINNRLTALEQGKPISKTLAQGSPTPIMSSNVTPPQFLSPPPPVYSSRRNPSSNSPSARAAVLQELQSLFEKRKKLK